ncbi:MAG: hypothetical protein C4538_06215 [Nitrospiraceae bacterium]|nr:MAG: hypothetical protein C4538_06215 [Nitrospiraceae bacterium]
MKRSVSVLLALLAVLAFAVSAFATHPSEPAEKAPIFAKGKSTIELGGSIRFRGDYRADIISTAGAVTTHKADYDGRVRLHMNAYVSDNTMGRVHLESGDDNNDDTYTWGCDAGVDGSGTAGLGQGNCKKEEVQVLEAWIQHQGSGLLGMPAGIKIGHMPLKLGRGLFFDHTRFGDDAINVFVKPMDNLTVEYVNVKFTEGTATDADDETDGHVLIAGYKGGAFNASADVTYLRDKDLGGKDGTNLWNYAIRGDVDAGMAKIYAEIDLQSGKIKDATTDKNFKGYAFVVGADAKMADVGLNLEFGYGSGDNDDTDDDQKAFQTSLSAIQKDKFTYVYDYRQFAASGSTNTGISNTTYVRLGADAKATPDLSVAAELYWLRASKSYKDTVAGTAIDEKGIGVELDARANYKIDANFSYFIEGGILFAGDLYDEIAKAADTEDDFSNPWVVRHGVVLAF